MSVQKYQSHQLIFILDSVLEQNSDGVLSLKTRVDSWQQQRSSILVLRHGGLVYGGTQVPKAPELCSRLGERLKPNLIKAALSITLERVTDPNSASKMLDMLVRMRVFTWQEVEALVNQKILLIIEKFLPYAGEVEWHPGLDLELGYGSDRHSLNWAEIALELRHRAKIWQSYQPQISGIDAIPIVTPRQLRSLDNPQIQEHFRQSVDGTKTIWQIAEKLGKDPLKVAKNYHNWANNGWMSFAPSPTAGKTLAETKNPTSTSASTVAESKISSPTTNTSVSSNLPTVLSVDDSAIIQTTIKRALQADYNVLLAQRADEALKILQSVRVELMLLDLTMPDVDGLEFCKSIRAIPKFKDMPIVMVTARDGLVNKMKGHIAGTNKYLTKPFKADQLQEVVRQYINS